MFRRSMVLLLLLGCGGVLSGADYSAQIASVKAGKTAEAKAVWWGYDKTDATKCLQAALDSGARKVIVDNVGSDWIIGPVVVPSNVEVVFQDGVVMRAKPGAWQEKQGKRFVQRRMFEIHGKKNVTLRGIGRVKLEFPASEQKDHRHTVSILDSDGITVDKIKFYGYDNYAEADAYISNLNGVTYNSTEYVFPAKDENGNVTLTSHTFDFSEQPASGNIDFTVAGKQCGLAITLFCKDSASGITAITTDNRSGLEKGKKILQDGQLLIYKGGNWYNLAGQIVEQDARPDK